MLLRLSFDDDDRIIIVHAENYRETLTDSVHSGAVCFGCILIASVRCRAESGDGVRNGLEFLLVVLSLSVLP